MNDNYFNFFPWEEYRPNQKEAIERITRNIWQHKRLIVLAEDRFLSYVDLFPTYIKDGIVILNEYNLVLEHAKTFWEKQ